MSIHKRETQAEAFLNSQPLELEPLITDCIVDTDTFVEAKALFLKKLQERKPPTKEESL